MPCRNPVVSFYWSYILNIISWRTSAGGRKEEKEGDKWEGEEKKESEGERKMKEWRRGEKEERGGCMAKKD